MFVRWLVGGGESGDNCKDVGMSMCVRVCGRVRQMVKNSQGRQAKGKRYRSDDRTMYGRTYLVELS